MLHSLSNLAFTQFGQVTLLILLVGLAHRLLADRSPRLTLCLWSLVIIKGLTPPVFSSPVGLFSWLQAPAVSHDRAGETLLALDLAPSTGWPGGLVSGLMIAWAIGSTLALGWTLLQKHRLGTRLERDALDADNPLTVYTNTLAQRYGLRKPSRVVVSQDDYGPAVVGVRKPTMVFPASLLRDRDPAVLRPVLLHELVHLTRRDTWGAALGAAARIVWWFHPAVWWATRQAEKLVERCVDLRVTRDLETSLHAYGRGLVRVLEMRASLQTDNGSVGLRPCQITTERLEFLQRVDERNPYGHAQPSRWAGFARVAVITCLAAVLLPALPTDALLPKCEPGPATADEIVARAIAKPTLTP
ncbi:Regulatory protein BlaR1 [Planctomycetes bacterium MalM25]|nr:Regulatory protein BlaR1 [Planctomycetes bacterium MalM25]